MNTRFLRRNWRALFIIAGGSLVFVATPTPVRADLEAAGACMWCTSTCQRTGNFCSNMSGSCGEGAGACSSQECTGQFGNTYPASITCEVAQ